MLTNAYTTTRIISFLAAMKSVGQQIDVRLSLHKMNKKKKMKKIV